MLLLLLLPCTLDVVISYYSQVFSFHFIYVSTSIKIIFSTFKVLDMGEKKFIFKKINFFRDKNCKKLLFYHYYTFFSHLIFAKKSFSDRNYNGTQLVVSLEYKLFLRKMWVSYFATTYNN